MFQNDSLIFIDPVDPSRNVASPVSFATLSHVSRMAKMIEEKTVIDFFWPFSRRPISPGKGDLISSYPGGYIGHRMDLPEGNPGIVISQLRRSIGRCRDELLRSGFESVEIGFRILASSDEKLDPSYLRNRGVYLTETGEDRIEILMKVEPRELGKDMIHWGPPVDNPRNIDFRAKWSDRKEIFERNGRLFVMLERKERDPSRMLMSIWDEISHGAAFKGSFLTPAGEKEIFDTDNTHPPPGKGQNEHS
jgi:tRNA nucleotidyltransferase (CCA-adding enzyme)